MRKAMIVGYILLFLAAPCVFWFLSRPINHRISEDGYHDVKMGMTEQEVIAVLGVPAGDYGPGEGEIIETGGFTITSHMIRTDPNGKKWLAGDFAITVCFDANGQVRGKGTDSVYRPNDTTFEMLCQRVGLKDKKPHPPGSFNWLLKK